MTAKPIALVTGAASGLGRLAAVRLAEAGATVAVADRNADTLQAVARAHGKLIAYPLDVTDEVAVTAMVSEVESGLGPISRLVHAAGIMPAGRLMEMSSAQIRRATEVNYFGTVHVMNAVLPGMLRRHAGDVVIFGSITGYVLSTRFGAYCASKAAVNAYAEILMQEHRGDGIRFALVCPSTVSTPLLDQAVDTGPAALRAAVRTGRVAKPDTVLNAVEKKLQRGGGHVVLPGQALPLYLLRRLSPALTWRVLGLANRAALHWGVH